MDIFEYIDPIVFFIALGIGVLIAYVLNPSPTVVYKYPTPDNIKNTTYLDDEKVCYKYKSEEVEPPTNDSNTEVVELE